MTFRTQVGMTRWRYGAMGIGDALSHTTEPDALALWCDGHRQCGLAHE